MRSSGLTHQLHCRCLPSPQQPVTAELVETAIALIKEERTGAHHLRELAHQDKDASAGLQSVLIEMMAMDSEKHARLLQFVHDRLVEPSTRQRRPVRLNAVRRLDAD